MILKGKLRRKADFTRKDDSGQLCKLWIEHEISRENADEGDLRLEELFVSEELGKRLSTGKECFLDVRPYPKGNVVGMSVVDASHDLRELSSRQQKPAAA